MKIFRGFTLIEIMVVVAIIGILSTIVIVNYSSAKGKARYTKVVSDMVEIKVAVEGYKRDHGFYPCDVGYNILPDNSSGHTSEPYCPAGATQIGDGGVTSSLNSWPTPPITNASYDWEGWWWFTVPARVSLRRTSDGYNVMAHFCIFTSDSTRGCNTDNTPNIETMADKSFPASY